MANRRMDPVRYRRFEAQPLVPEGLLAVAREGGDLERRVAQGLARTADYFGQRADRAAETLGTLEGQQAALAGMPQAGMITGDLAAPSMTDAAPRGIRVTRLPANVDTIITEAASRYGIDPEALKRIAELESGGNPNAKNPNSSAGGLFQFIDSTAAAYGLQNRFDPVQSADAAARLARDNSRYLSERLGRAPTAAELYLAHQQGPAGAARLLSNPSARASDIVGAQAVTLNGGSADMSAGDFSRLWLQKAGQTAGSIDPASVAPVSVTPVSFTPGSGGDFRPTGADTIRGRAYDIAGTRTYLERLDGVLRSDMRAVFDVHGENPAMLSKALGELKTAHLAEHVFPEIAADYEVAFQAQADRLVEEARGQARRRAEEQNRADFLQRTYELEEEKSRLLVSTSINPDLAMADLQSAQASVDAHYDSAVARGVMSPVDAEKLKRQSRSEMVEGFYLRQADALDADGVATMREAMQADYAAGRLEGVDAAGWNRIDTRLTALAENKRSQDRQAATALAKRGDDIAARIAAGHQVDEAEISRLRLDASTNSVGSAIADESMAKIDIASAIRDLPPA
jgi:soluble lytic murein transglycosylase-like protein